MSFWHQFGFVSSPNTQNAQPHHSNVPDFQGTAELRELQKVVRDLKASYEAHVTSHHSSSEPPVPSVQQSQKPVERPATQDTIANSVTSTPGGQASRCIGEARRWNCTCQGFSDTFETHSLAWNMAAKDLDRLTLMQWWLNYNCTTTPAKRDATGEDSAVSDPAPSWSWV